MADFLDEEVEVTSGEDEEAMEEDDDDEIQSPRKKKLAKKKKKRTAQIDDDDDEDDDEDHVDDVVREQLADFIQDDVIEDEGVEEEDRKRKRSDDEEDVELEEDDYELIEENIGVKMKRGPKFIRVRAAEEVESDEEKKVKGKDDVGQELFGEGGDSDDSDAPAKSAAKRPQNDRAPRLHAQDEDMPLEEEDNSDDDSFIVDDDGKPIHSHKSRGGSRRYDDVAMQEAQDIFGLDFDVEDLEEAEEEYDEEYEEEDEDGEVIRHTRRKKSRKSVMEVYEPSDLEHNLKTQADNAIRLADVPERFQLRSIPVEAPAPIEKAPTELLEEARWIHRQLFEENTLSNQAKTQTVLKGLSKSAPPVDNGGWGPVGGQVRFDAADTEMRVGKIKEILDFIRLQHLEDRFISTYRKESFEPDFTAEDIHEIYERDLLWMQLQRRRVNLVKLMIKMQEYLQKWRLDNPMVFEEGDEVSDDAINQVRNATTLVELADLFSEFRMIYGHHLPNLHKTDEKKATPAPKKTAEPVFDENGMLVEPETVVDEEETPVPPPTPDAPVVKRASRTDPYFLYKQAGLDKFVEKFGLTAEKLAVNVEGMFAINEIEQEPVDPEVVAEGFISQRCPNVAEVTKGAVSMMSWLIARNAHFRRVARQFFVRNAVLNVSATARGLKEIDENHSCFGFKWLLGKPTGDLVDDQYLRIIQAKKDGQLECKILIGPDATSGKDQFLTKVMPLLSVDEFTTHVTAWNALRTKALEKAMTEILYPAFEKEVHEQLLVEAKAYVKAEIRRKLHDAINVAPYVVTLETQAKDENWDENEWGLQDGIRVMGIAFEDNRDSAGFAAVVDGFGEVLDYVKLPTLMKNTYGQGHDIRVTPEDITRIVDLFRDKKPHVLAIASETRKALDIKEALNQRFNSLMYEAHGPRRETPIEIVDNLLSILYQNSETGRMEFPSHTPVLRQAISIARRLMDPLLAYSQLYNMDDDILNLNFHPLQSQLSKEEFRNALQVEFVRRVNEVGVDLNQCVSHPLTHGSVVQFVCGLGPRKAQHIMKMVKQNGVIVIRNQLVTVCRLGPKVFINCAGFIKINVDDLSDAVTGDQYTEPLDASRVHPEAYEWARKMAVDALDFDESNPSDALLEIIDKPEKLQELDLDAFGVELQRLEFGDKHITLSDIKQELNERFRETRPVYQSPSQEHIFEMIIGEPLSEYRVGRLVSVTVNGFNYKRAPSGGASPAVKKVADCDDWFCPQCRLRGFTKPDQAFIHMEADCPGEMISVKVSLDNGIWGYIPLQYLSDRHPIQIPQERVKKGMIVHARIRTAVEPTKFNAEFTCRSSDLTDSDGIYKPPRDPKYDYKAEDIALQREQKKRTKMAPKTNFLKRVIAHAAFKNVNFEEAEKFLTPATVPVGEAIIRPSSKANNKLTLSWKVANGIHDHVEISERDKENAFSLGRKLIIDEEEYDDLDEILARYVQPMATLVNDLVQHKYHVDSHGGLPGVQRDVQRMVIDRWLREQKAAMPNRIPFCFSECVSSPRRFFLCHLPRENVREEFITVTPRGYQYRRLNFNTLNHLIKYFKDHFHEPPPAPLGTTPHASLAMSAAGMTGGTPRLGANPNLAALTQAVNILPAHVWERLREAGGSTSRATPNVFATPRTPSGSTYNPTGARGAASAGVTPSGATPSSVTSAAPWGRAAQMWQQAMTGQPVTNTPGTPGAASGATPTAPTTNWAAAAAAWVSGNSTGAAEEPPSK